MGRTTLILDTSGFERYLARLQTLSGNVERTVERALKDSAEQIRDDTLEAIAKPHLPALGKYSHGDTKKSVVTDTTPHWEGRTAWVPIGFDFSKPGAGGYLITGTPKMQPDKKLHAMYKQKKYMADIQRHMANVVLDEIAEEMTK